MNPEQQRLQENITYPSLWYRWGPYLSERQWGTVREDYSQSGSAWEYFPHDHARSRAYRWGEDGIAGFSDRKGHVCFAVAMWNGKDPILKERLYGVSNSEGNHGEDVKESYFYLDNTPTHSYMKYLYKYPQREYPYRWLSEENRRRDKSSPEFELADTGVFDDNRYFDLFVEYAKQSQEDVLIRITVHNRGPEEADIHLLPTLWFRNRWSWNPTEHRPRITRDTPNMLHAESERYGNRWLYCDDPDEFLFTENETNNQRLYGTPNRTPYVKDAFHEYVVRNKRDAVNPEMLGTKAAAIYRRTIPAGGSIQIRLRLTHERDTRPFDETFDALFAQRIQEADEFYESLSPDLPDDLRNIQRQAYAGLLWNKQVYHYDVAAWIHGDELTPPPSPARQHGRNGHWQHFHSLEVISMPDKWEYPWFAAWDSAFHCIPFALIDPQFAKDQLILLLREWYMHPNGQIPAYEWAFDDVNPPVHAWAAWRVYQIDRRMNGTGDTDFLARVFHKLLLNFTWWVNRKDDAGNNIFEGGFLGLDNIGVFDRNQPMRDGSRLEQSDGTSWMAMYCLNMLTIALELATIDPSYEDVASKFFEHFVYIADAMNHVGAAGDDLWDEEDGFYYDVIHRPDGRKVYVKLRSMVGLIPMFAVMTMEADYLERFPGFRRRMDWFLKHRPQMLENIACPQKSGQEGRRLLALVPPDRLRLMLRRMLDETEFLSEFGLRALSKFHDQNPYSLQLGGETFRVRYTPAESTTYMFGGNSNWRGPIWFPLNYLIIESLQKFDFYFGADFLVEYPTGSGKQHTLWEISQELSRRLIHIFARGDNGLRAAFAENSKFQHCPYWRDHLQFFEYFNGDTGRGLGASQQTGWTGLVAKLIDQSGT